MKRIFCVLSSLVILAACNSASESETDVKDSVLEKIDSTADARIDSVKEASDSLEQKVENTFEKTDSANKAIADSAKSNN